MDDEYYINQLEKLEARLNDDTEEARFRKIAREEANKRIDALLVPLGIIVTGWYIAGHYGATWWWLFLATLFGWFILATWWQGRTKEYDKHLVGLYAQDVCRIDYLQALNDKGIEVWQVDAGAPRKVVADTGTHWDGWWRSVYETALIFEKLTANQRLARVKAAAQAALPMLVQGEQLARNEQAELPYWARDMLCKARSN